LRHKIIKLLVLFFILIISVSVSLFIGSADISVFRIFDSDAINEKNIFYMIRLPRILNSAFTGAALSCAGIILQSLFRNNLAEPGLLGISAGAGLGAILIFMIPGVSFLLIAPVSFLTAMLTTVIIFYLAKGLSTKYTNFLTSNKIILAGIAINALLSSINGFLLIYSGNSVSQIIYWLSGGFSGRGWTEFGITSPIIITGILISLLLGREYNVLALGAELSVSVGLNTKRLQNISIILSSLLAAAAVSIAGIISFVGLIVPNIARLFIGSDNRFTIPASMLLGSVFLVISDTIARTIISPSEIPVGIITSFIGAPVFIWLILKKDKSEKSSAQ